MHLHSCKEHFQHLNHRCCHLQDENYHHHILLGYHDHRLSLWDLTFSREELESQRTSCCNTHELHLSHHMHLESWLPSSSEYELSCLLLDNGRECRFLSSKFSKSWTNRKILVKTSNGLSAKSRVNHICNKLSTQTCKATRHCFPYFCRTMPYALIPIDFFKHTCMQNLILHYNLMHRKFGSYFKLWVPIKSTPLKKVNMHDHHKNKTLNTIGISWRPQLVPVPDLATRFKILFFCQPTLQICK